MMGFKILSSLIELIKPFMSRVPKGKPKRGFSILRDKPMQV